jgi:hypothetical protein
MDMLKQRIMRAIAQGAMLAGSAAMIGCSSTDETPDKNGWTVSERDMASGPDQSGTPDMTTQPDMAVGCGATLGVLPSEKYQRGTFGGGLYPNEVPVAGAYVMCAPLAQGASCAPGASLTREQLYAHLDASMGQQSNGCGTSIVPSGDAGACGPVAGLAGECCYVMEVQISQCVEGRPFVIGGIARTAAVAAQEGWCDVAPARGAELTAAQREEIAAVWAQAGLHEHASVASFGKFMMELLSMGAPRELVAQAAKAIQDEIEHARVCFSVASSYAGHPVGPDAIDVTNSVIGRPDDAALLEAVIAEGCIGETLSAAQVAAQAAWVEDAELKAALERIAADEAEHAALAWGFVSWMLASKPELAPVAQRALTRGFVHPSSPSATGMTGAQAQLLAHGVLPSALEADVRREAYRSVVAAMEVRAM